MKGYIFCHYNVTDTDRIDELGPIALPIVEKYGGRILVASASKNLENSPYSRMVVYEFPSPENAKAYYESDENQAVVKLRQAMTDGIVMFAPGYVTEE